MRATILLVGLMVTAGPALAQSSNTSSNSSSDNGVVRERVVDTYCDDGRCERTVERRVTRDDRRGWRERREARWRDRDDDRRERDRDDDDDD